MNLFDAVVFAILLLAIYTGFKRGLKSFFSSLISLILAFVSAYLFYKPIGGIIERKFKLFSIVYSYVKSKINPGVAILPATVLKSKIVSFLNSLKMPPSVIKNIKSIVDKLSIPSNQTIGQFLPHFLAQLVVGAVAFILIFITAYLVFKLILHWILKGEETNPKLKRLGAIGNFILVFIIIFYLLGLYDSSGMSILIPNHYIVNLINKSLCLKIARMLHPLFSSVIGIFLGGS